MTVSRKVVSGPNARVGRVLQTAAIVHAVSILSRTGHWACQDLGACSKSAAMCQWSRSLIGSVSWVSSAILVVVAFGVEPAFAAGRRSKDNRESQEKAARKACLTGDYAAGISILADMFVEYREPVFVFNQGRCLEQNARYKDAMVRFDEYLRMGDTMKLPEGAREIAQKHIEDCKAKLAEEKQATAPQPIAQPVPQPIPQAAPPPEVTAPTVEKPSAKPEPSSGGNGLLVGGIVTGSLGVGAVVAGYFLGKKSNDMISEMQTNPDKYTSAKHSSQQTYKTLAWVSYGVGAACIAGGAVMIAIGASRRASPTQTEVALVPALGPGQAGILLRGGF
jgi:hypothetical protein